MILSAWEEATGPARERAAFIELIENAGAALARLTNEAIEWRDQRDPELGHSVWKHDLDDVMRGLLLAGRGLAALRGRADHEHRFERARNTGRRPRAIEQHIVVALGQQFGLEPAAVATLLHEQGYVRGSLKSVIKTFSRKASRSTK